MDYNKNYRKGKNEQRAEEKVNLPPRINIVTALEFAQCSIYIIRSLVVPNAFSRTNPA